jgi:hypothetical protein
VAEISSNIVTITSDNSPVDEEQLLAVVDSRIRNQEVIIRDSQRQWFINVAMRRGLQYVQSHAGTGLVVMPPDSEDRIRIIVNKMLGIHQTRVAKLVADLPDLEVIPASAQEEDKDLARKGSKLLSWLWAEEKMVEKSMSALSWAVDCGNAFFHISWDTDKGTQIPTFKRHRGPMTDKMPYKIDEEGYILDAQGARIEERLSVGDVSIVVHSPFDIINDGVSTNIQESQWIIMQEAVAIQDIRKRWGDRGNKVSPERDLNTRAYFQRRLQTMVGNQSTYFAPEPKTFEDMAIVKTMWEKPTDKYPEGRRVVIANGVLLESGPMPYKHRQYPLVKVGDIEVSGSFWDISTMENLIPIQKGYNRTWSQILENANNMGNIKAVLTKNHGLLKEAYDDTGMEILEVNPGIDVHQLQPAELPAYVQNQLQWYDKAFEDISGQHEMKNVITAGATSGKALLVVQEQDDTRLAPTKLRLHRALEEVGYQALCLYDEFQDEGREYQILGDSAYDLDEFKITKDDIQSMKKDVRVQSENIIASHVRLKQDNLMELVDKGIFDPNKMPPEIAKKVLKLFEFGQTDELFDDINQDRSQARRENQQFINHENLISVPSPEGTESVISLPVYDFEDHEVHFDEHNSLRKSPRYRQMTDNLRRGIDLHVQLHEKFLNPPPPPPEKPRASVSVSVKGETLPQGVLMPLLKGQDLIPQDLGEAQPSSPSPTPPPPPSGVQGPMGADLGASSPPPPLGTPPITGEPSGMAGV